MKILLLGGTADARRLADSLHQFGLKVVYSLAGLVRVPKVDCQLVVGGFTQFGGLVKYLRDNNIGAILDVTHPYAQTMSSKAVMAAKEMGIPCWRFHRPAWQQKEGDHWQDYQDEADLLAQLDGFRVPLLSAGQMSEAFLERILQLPSIERIVWRTAVAPKFPLPDNINWIKAIGPFALEDERQLLVDHGIDVIVSKNSGGSATYSKLEAARELSIPVLLHARPILPEAEREFSDTDDCLQACLAAWGKTSSHSKNQPKDSQQ
ncbi:precorrin-6A/cobalt-precorrin-6A reductase [Marinomonas sp. M1K-6]|uniref:Precorrin-6A/cobalt-precorrin-6A reductase n=1 Tax=Marinomonas profundi TaxID=2726122 RepID=A0A847R8K9_9GAMM|nr:precorrin-6A/cobalt-precorrin-6A reductase [Marinomonas profundi]NLQ16600.1 precorrin-6A/cobalt-precorrin-6A reductase [Marinomonas profundi]UDV03816.1 precorrin-6A/cobalt-precorrin-6A reductase [Marinomonas profundi]